MVSAAAHLGAASTAARAIADAATKKHRSSHTRISGAGGYVPPLARQASRSAARRLPRCSRWRANWLRAPRASRHEGPWPRTTGPRLRAEPLANPLAHRARRARDPAEHGQHREALLQRRKPAAPRRAPRLPHRREVGRRAGLDYWHFVALEQHLDLAHFAHRHPGSRLRLFSAIATEELPRRGLPARRRARLRQGERRARSGAARPSTRTPCSHPDARPRALANLANAAAIVVYEALRQVGAAPRRRPRMSRVANPVDEPAAQRYRSGAP